MAEDNRKRQNDPPRVYKNFRDLLQNGMVREEYNVNNIDIPEYNRNDVSKIFKKMLHHLNSK
jgi:flagellar basal body rod protein FlgB